MRFVTQHLARLIVFSSMVSPFFQALHAADAPEASAEAARLKSWIADLKADAIRDRQEAANKIVRAGKPALPLLLDAAGIDRDLTFRIVDIVLELSFSSGADTAVAALRALDQLASSRDPDTKRSASRAQASRPHRAAKQLRELGAIVFMKDNAIVEVNFNARALTDADLRWLRGLEELTDLSLENTRVGDAGLACLAGLTKLEWLNLYRTQVGDEGLMHLKSLRNLQHLPIGETRVTEAGLIHLKEMRRLQYLGLRGDPITDAGLAHVKDLTQLSGLHLGETKVTDTGLAHLTGMIHLRQLWLNSTAVSDQGIEFLEKLKGLKQLFVANTGITDQGVVRLKRSLPDCTIER